MRAAAPLLVALALAAAAPGRADEPLEGIFFSARGGAGLPWGEIAHDGPLLRDTMDWRASFGIELGYRVSPRYWPELYLDMAPATHQRALCDTGTDCSGSDTRFGVALLVRLLPGARVDPWFGLGAGVEVLRARARDRAGRSVSLSWIGVEGTLEAGIDVQVADAVTVGPWLSGAIGRFTSDSARVEGGDLESARVGHGAAHGWMSCGAKVTMKL